MLVVVSEENLNFQNIQRACSSAGTFPVQFMLMARKIVMVKNHQKRVEELSLHYSHDVLLSSRQKPVTDRMESGFWTNPASFVTLWQTELFRLVLVAEVL